MMLEQTLLIAFDAFDPAIDVRAFKEHLKQDPTFTHWWNHLPGVFLVTASLSADEVAERLRTFTGEGRFLVVAIKPEQSEGWLPEKSWKWIKRRERELGRKVALSDRI